MAPVCGKSSHDFLVKTEITKPGEYSFGWFMSETLQEQYKVKFTVVMYPTTPKMSSKKLMGDDCT
jgi:hypothetical protein